MSKHQHGNREAKKPKQPPKPPPPATGLASPLLKSLERAAEKKGPSVKRPGG